MKKILCFIAVALMGVVAFAQTVTLTFTGRDAVDHYVQLNRMSITNLTKSWQETIYWPDTTLTMQNGTGIDESVANGGFVLSQNNPNPFSGTTDVNLTVADAGAVTLEIADGNGKTVGTHRVHPEIGTHQFRVSLSTAGTYVMTARQNGKKSSVKMVCNGGGSTNAIEYLGMVQSLTYVLKSTTNNPFNFGDMMEYVGFATINGTEVESQRITQAQGTSQMFVLQFSVEQHQTPIVTTTAVSNVTETSATCGGTVTSDGGANVIVRGVCYSTSPAPTTADNHTTDGSGTGSFTSSLTGLTAGTTYYVRAYATNSVGTAYGNEVSFTTTTGSTAQDGQPCSGAATLTDIDGNTYNTVQIGQQCWMKENLRTTKYADNTDIAQGNGTSEDTPYWYYPGNNASNVSTYGLLYNWKAVMGSSSSSSSTPSGIQGVCPNGWHAPSDAEWTVLANYVSSQSQFVCGNDNMNIAKALASNTGWAGDTNTCSVGNIPSDNNTTCFSAFPSGFYYGSYTSLGLYTYFWSATETNSSRAYYRNFDYNRSYLRHSNEGKQYGFSVRCVRDEGGVSQTVPTVTTSSVTSISTTSATCGGNVTSDGGATVTAKGVCWSTGHNPTTSGSHTTDGSGMGSFTSSLTSLTAGTTYYVRAYATNSVGTAYGNEVSFTTTTAAQLPTVTTTAASNVTETSATCGGTVTTDGGANVIVRGVCYSTSPAPTTADSHTTDGSGTGSFTSGLTGLTAGTTYYVRAYATNSVGTAYGNEVSFTTSTGSTAQDGQPCPGTATLTDIDGNTYNTAQIGQQCWMKENLKTTKYADGTSISQSSSVSTTTAYWYYPNNDFSNKSTYGLLYNWKAVMRNSSSSTSNPSGVQGICPTGWHVPSDAEWTQLTDYVRSQSQFLCSNNSTYIGKALAGTTGWSSSTTSCAVGNTPDNNNATGFGALPAGHRYGNYGNFGESALFWSATEFSSDHAYDHYLNFNNAGVDRSHYYKKDGFSVRCIRDEGSVSQTVPTVTTSSVTSIGTTSATCGGTVTSDGGATVTARGVCWSTSHNPTTSSNHTTDGSGTGSFTSSLTGLTAGTTYYVRAYATNSVGTAYGNEVCFNTTSGGSSQDGQPCPGATTLTDIDGNIYNTVLIGNQCWMKENLRTTHYANSSAIEQGSSTSTTTPYWYYPNNYSANMSTYGLLYNWKAVMGSFSSSSANPSGVQGICPTGWHVPSDAEWTQLTDYVSNQSQYVCGSDNTQIAKALAGTTGWNSSTVTCAIGNTPTDNNATGFSALPAGCYGSSYSSIGNVAVYWSATEFYSDGAIGRRLSFQSLTTTDSTDGEYKYYGHSVRCVKN